MALWLNGAMTAGGVAGPSMGQAAVGPLAPWRGWQLRQPSLSHSDIVTLCFGAMALQHNDASRNDALAQFLDFCDNFSKI